MAWKQVKNWASTTIPAAVSDSALTITVADATLLPAAEFWAVIWNAGEGAPDADTAREIVLVTDVTGNVLTITRAQQSTVAAAHPAGCTIANVVTAGDKTELTAWADSHTHTLDGLSDVDTTGVADGNALSYTASTQTWGPSAAGSGDVTGPAGATSGNLASYADATGKVLADSGSKPADFATAAKGVTNGDSHNHAGGDGAQIDHTGLSNIGTNAHSVIDSHLGNTSNPHTVTAAQLSLGATDNVAFGGIMSTKWTVLAGSDYTNTTTTLGTAYTLTGLTAGATYAFRAVVHATVKTTEGIKICLGASSITSIIYQIIIRNAATGAVVASARKTAVGNVLSYTGADADLVIEMEGSVVINSASTLGVRAAQQAAGANAATVLIGSSLCCWRTA